MVKIENLNRKLGIKLKKLRQKENLSRKDLAFILGITPGAIAMYEQGRRVPIDSIKTKYSMYFDKTVDEIFFT